MAKLSAVPPAVRIGPGTYRVEIDGRTDVVYAVSTPRDTWFWWRGRAYRIDNADSDGERGRPRSSAVSGRQALAAPMPARVLKINVAPGAQAKKGDALIVLEAMKMEMPLRALADGVVTSVNCREGELVQPETILVELG